MNTQCVPAPENAPQNRVPSNWIPGVSAQTPLPSPASKPVQPSPQLAPVFYTIPEAAAVLNVCTKTVRRLIARRFLTSCNVLRKKLIPREQIERFLKATCDAPVALK